MVPRDTQCSLVLEKILNLTARWKSYNKIGTNRIMKYYSALRARSNSLDFNCCTPLLAVLDNVILSHNVVMADAWYFNTFFFERVIKRLRLCPKPRVGYDAFLSYINPFNFAWHGNINIRYYVTEQMWNIIKLILHIQTFFL